MQATYARKQHYGFLGLGRYQCDIYTSVEFTAREIRIIKIFDLQHHCILLVKSGKDEADENLYIHEFLHGTQKQTFYIPLDAEKYMADFTEALQVATSYLAASADTLR